MAEVEPSIKPPEGFHLCIFALYLSIICNLKGISVTIFQSGAGSRQDLLHKVLLLSPRSLKNTTCTWQVHIPPGTSLKPLGSI